MTRVHANLVLLLAGAMWGMGFVAQSTAMQAVGPFLFIGLRFVAALVSILPFALREARRADASLARADWLRFGVIGLFLFGGMASQQVGLMTTSVTNSGFLTGLYVVMVPILGVALFREWPHAIVWPGASMALAGIWLLSGGGAAGMVIGDWLTIVCAGFWALQMIFIARWASTTGRPITLAVTQFAVCAALGLFCAIAFEPIEGSAIVEALPEILYAGIFSGGIAFTLQVVGQRYTTASQAALFLASESVFAAIFGAAFLGERIALAGFVGCALIFSAIVLVEIVPGLTRKTA